MLGGRKRGIVVEELFELRDHIINHRYGEALTLVEEMEEMSRQDKVNEIYSFSIILVLHLIKQEIEQRSTRSWALSIRNSARQIARVNKLHKASGNYLAQAELAEAVSDAFSPALEQAAIEALEGRYSEEELEEMLDRQVIEMKALESIAAFAKK